MCIYIEYQVCIKCPQKPEEVLDPLKLKFLIVVSHLIWVLKTKLRFSGRAVFAVVTI